MGKLGKDVKDLIVGNDGADKEPDDFKTELQKAIDNGLISKSDGTLLITSRMNADKLADIISKSQEKGVTLAKDAKEFNSPEEELEYKKEKEEKERKRKEKEAEIARRQQEAMKNSEKTNLEPKISQDREINDDKR